MELKIYKTPDCPYCIQLQKILDLLRIPYIDIDVDDIKNQDEYNNVVQIVDHFNIPVIKIDDRYLSPNKDFMTIPEAANIIFKIIKK